MESTIFITISKKFFALPGDLFARNIRNPFYNFVYSICLPLLYSLLF